MYVKPFKVGRDEVIDGKLTHTDDFDVMRDNNLRRLLIGIAQGNMNWTYTHEEVMTKLNRGTNTEEEDGVGN
jgi:hypothetical protein